jgi:hypothetical protein
MTERDHPDGLEWERGWDGHARAQQRRLARLSLMERLAWLEETHRLLLRIEDSRKRQAGGVAGSEAGKDQGAGE